MKIYNSLVDRLKNQHLTINELIETLPESRKALRPTKNKWSIHDNVAHLTKYQLVFIGRITKILNEQAPQFERYKAEDDPDFEKFRNMSESDLVGSLKKNRVKLNELVLNLSRTDLERIGIHKKFGNLNIIQWLEFFVLHEAHHIYTIFQLANDIDLQNGNDI
jgi:uncharacterized damage-inducible protein DinB